MFRLVAPGRSRCLIGLSKSTKRTFCGSKKTSKTAAELAEEALVARKDTACGETKAVDIFMTAMRVMVVLGVVSSMSSNSRLVDEAKADDKVSTNLERTIEIATTSILKEEWRADVSKRLQEGDANALNRELAQLLVVVPSPDEGDEQA